MAVFEDSTAVSRRHSMMMIGAVPLVAAALGSEAFGQVAATPALMSPFDPGLRFAPISPILAGKTKIWRVGTEVEVPWASLSEKERRMQLSNQDARVSVEKISNGASVGYMDSGISADKGSYRVTVDYMRFKDELVRTASGIVGRGKVGVGIRVTANVITKKSGISLLGLLPIAFNWSRQYLSGELEIKSIGIVSPEVAKIISTPTSLNEESIAKSMEAFGAFRVIVDQDATVTVPHLMAVARSDPNAASYAIEKTAQDISASIS